MSWTMTVRKLASKIRPLTLFAWFLSSFGVIILLFSCFTFFSALFFSDRVKNEVIQYNNLILDSAIDEYEKQFQLITDSVLSFSMSVDVQSLNKPDYSFLAAMETRTSIQHFLNNSSLRIDNLIMYFGKSSYSLDKSRGTSNGDYFSRYLLHPDKPASYWNSIFERKEPVTYLPTEIFYEQDGNGNVIAPPRQLPIVIRNQFIPDFVIVALIRADQLYDSFFQSINDNFYIRDSHGQLLYSPANADNRDASVPIGDAFKQNNGEYWFQQKGDYTKFTYSTQISDASIAAKTTWQSSFFAILLLVVLLSVIMSFVFAFRLQSPVKRMIEALQHQSAGDRPISRIKEFSEIQVRVKQIVESNRDISHDLKIKNSILRHYAVIDVFKRTSNGLSRFWDLRKERRPFRILLFQIHYMPGLLDNLDFAKERATPYMKEVIDQLLKDEFPEKLSCQIERELIIAVLFGETEEKRVRAVIEQISAMMRNEREYCFLTMGVGQSRGETDDLTEAYESALTLLKLRTFDSPGQVLFEPLQPQESSPYTLDHEDAFDSQLAEGQFEQAMDMVEKTIRTMKKRQALHSQVIAFAESLAVRIELGCSRLGLNTKELRALKGALDDCHTYDQLKQWFQEQLNAASALHDMHRIKRDPIIAFVSDYIETHYDSVISLELLADKLNLSRSYLSTYFKDKTGVYFVDFVNSVRIRRVLPLLAQPGAKIQDAAASVGYQNINTFNRIFKKMTGTTPSEYRLRAISLTALDPE
ncbi:helix-turn-helix domain-containing protein [Paenibacillus koleovorans]|uniref:helix-turn-helix domain-containing protein n=1 Tax=Paenibacillus koleovorans TaxID=121608 RepID=UPI000FDB4F50|nr:helix-turn-helix domain-containing protein [Paenibacillus koleovorans]